jgi:hypothetical protein
MVYLLWSLPIGTYYLRRLLRSEPQRRVQRSSASYDKLLRLLSRGWNIYLRLHHPCCRSRGLVSLASTLWGRRRNCGQSPKEGFSALQHLMTSCWGGQIGAPPAPESTTYRFKIWCGKSFIVLGQTITKVAAHYTRQHCNFILNLYVTKNGLPAVKFTYRHILLKEATAVRAPKLGQTITKVAAHYTRQHCNFIYYKAAGGLLEVSTVIPFILSFL